MSGFVNAVKSLSFVVTAAGALAAIGAILKLLALFLQGMETAAAGGIPIDILTAMIIVLITAVIPWWLSVE